MTFKKCRNRHRRSSSVKKHTEMWAKTTDSSIFLFHICQPGVKTRRTSLQFFVKIRAKEVVLWRNKDVLLDVELFHARTSAFAFSNFFSLVFILWQPRFPKCLYRKREKLIKNAEFSKTVGPFPIFLRRWMGYRYVWCVHSRFQWWKNITFDGTMKLIMPKDTVACKDNWGERR